MNLKALCSLAILLVGFTSVNAQKFTIKSEILSEERAYWVSLPASYEQSHSSYKNYPVIYLLDGHIHFASVAGMCQFMGRPSNGSRKIPEMIVVGVMNVDRQRDFTPVRLSRDVKITQEVELNSWHF
jgi:predicted alpha/beta superfamily hydrolase